MTALARPRRPWDRLAPTDRDYFDVLGSGLVSVLPGKGPGDPASGDWQPPTGGAWVHVAEDGHVRAFTGKAEVGQGTRLALHRVVRQELRPAVGRLEIVMGDTDLCPWDMGTFGSRSMPDAAPALAAAARGARGRLVALAAERLGTSERDFEAGEGTVRVRGESRSVPYGDLVRGRRELFVAPRVEDWVPIGESVPHWEPEFEMGTEFVTGRRTYGSDLRPPGLWHGAVLHPPEYGARPVAVDTTPLEGRPGLVVLREGDFVGVIAPSAPEARAALADVRVTWESPRQPSEKSIETYLRSHPQTGDAWDREAFEAGGFDAAFSTAPFRLERTYRTAYIAHVPLETRCALAQWDADRVTVWVGTQTPFRAREVIASALRLPVDDVRVIVPPTGAGFGGKHGGDLGAAVARMARVARHPVRISYTREEEFRFAYFRPMSIVDVRLGADRSGTILAWSFHNVNGGAAALMAPYRVAHQKVDNELSNSPLPQGSYRALAATANNFARETAVDELARTTGADPVDVRRRNLEDERLREVLERTADRAGWSSWTREGGRGHGVAVGLEKNCRVGTVAEVSVDRGRRLRVDRLTAVVDAGSVVHSGNLRSQVEGALVMGIGGALFEAVRFDQGAIRNARFSDYRVPRFSDLPELDVELLDRPGVAPSGAGETPMIAVAPAIGNAIFDAAGVRLRSLPLAPHGVV